ncbi:MAG: hypothetical protein WBL21_05085 [Salinimicrobium sp.]
MFAVLAFLRLLNHPDNPWIYYLQLFLGLFILGVYLYKKRFQFLSIDNGILTKNNLRRNSVVLNDIIKIQSFPGKIKLFTSEEKLSINTELIEDESRTDFLKVLGALKVENNPFIGYSPKTS